MNYTLLFWEAHMTSLLMNLKWLESWEKNKKHNIEVGFDNHDLLKGYIPVTDRKSVV